jgi:hypothetical protein
MASEDQDRRKVAQMDRATKIATVRKMLKTRTGGVNNVEMFATESLLDEMEKMNLLNEETVKSVTNALLWCLAQNYHFDHANATVHNADVRFSPITFRLAEALGALDEDLAWNTEELGQYWGMLAEVTKAKGAYEEDTGR